MLVSDVAHSVVCYNKNLQDSIDPVIPIGLKLSRNSGATMNKLVASSVKPRMRPWPQEARSNSKLITRHQSACSPNPTLGHRKVSQYWLCMVRIMQDCLYGQNARQLVSINFGDQSHHLFLRSLALMKEHRHRTRISRALCESLSNLGTPLSRRLAF
jgi:hypothetical protein